MSAFQWLISQQDKYNGDSNCCADFLLTLYANFASTSFMYIFHDKEKDLHLHCILCLEHGMTKKELLRIFPSADIKCQGASNKDAFDYLTHSTKKAKEAGKIEYNTKDIIYNNFEENQLKDWLLLKPYKRKADEADTLDDIVDDIINNNIKTFKDVLLKYKGVALKYSKAIQEVLNNI